MPKSKGVVWSWFSARTKMKALLRIYVRIGGGGYVAGAKNGFCLKTDSQHTCRFPLVSP